MNRRRACAAALAATGALVAAPPVMAAQRTVDNDRAECPTAQYTSVQAVVDAAAPGDTVTICPGSYVEGTGLPGLTR